jgi:uncharacterized protein YndB with AHSA1/START domain
MSEDRIETEDRTVERETVLPASRDEVWEALTDSERLEEWLADDVELDPVEGGGISVSDDGGEARTGTVETVIERERLSFTWAAPGGDRSRVEFAVEAVPAGTRLVVTETSIAGPTALAGASVGAGATSWEARLLVLGCALLLRAEPAVA